MLCNEWAVFIIINIERSPLGYPSETVEKRIRMGTTSKSGKTTGAKIPKEAFKDCDPRLMRISSALFSMPAPWGHALYIKHLAPSKQKKAGGGELLLKTDGQRAGYYCESWGCGKSAYYTNLQSAYAYIMGLLKRPDAPIT